VKLNSNSGRCSVCGTEMSRQASGGHCLECLLRLGLTTEPQAPGRVFAPPLPSETTPLPAEQTGSRIGRYKVLEPIGEGGAGAVYLAEQQRPVRRRVALKIMIDGLVSVPYSMGHEIKSNYGKVNGIRIR